MGDEDLVGRQVQLDTLLTICDQASAGGSAVLIEGGPGAGKTALVDHVAVAAARRGFEILRVVGDPDESGLPYAALHALLRPSLAAIPHLPEPQRDALEVAFGIRHGEAPSVFLAGIATLTLLASRAAARPVLVIADDLHAFDSASRRALLMVGRRIASDPVVLMLTNRDHDDSVATTGIQRLHLGALAPGEAEILLDRRALRITPRQRTRLLEYSQGNPLALTELTISDMVEDDLAVVPLTRRLEESFAARAGNLSRPARLTALAAALGARTPLDAGSVAAAALDESLNATWLVEAEEQRLLVATSERIEFRHPLVRSALVQSARPADRRMILQALVATVGASPQSVWWRAGLAADVDADLADDLAAQGMANGATGDASTAARALSRAAALTPPGPKREERLLSASEALRVIGDHRHAETLLDRVLAESHDPGRLARAAWLRELSPGAGSSLSNGDLVPALAAIDALRRAGETRTALSALLHLSSITWDRSSHVDHEGVIARAARDFPLDPDDPSALLLAAVTDPVSRGEDVIHRIRNRPPSLPATATEAWQIGYALNLCGELQHSADYLEEAVEGFRAENESSLLPHSLMALAWIDFMTGRFAQGRSHVDEAISLASDMDDVPLGAAGRVALALFDALEGVRPSREAIVGSSSSAARALDAEGLRSTLVRAEGLAALVTGRPHDAERTLLRLTDITDSDYSLTARIVSLPDLIDASLQTRNRIAATRAVAAVRTLRETWDAPMLDVVLEFASVAMADDDDLDVALDSLSASTPASPYFRARTHLTAGRLLRQRREITRARELLHAALSAFETFPASRWADIARDELRATGIRLARNPAAARHALTPQELRIATLAAGDLTNREIADALFLSTRTVDAHLSSVYRKVGVSGRRQLSTVLQPEGN